MRILYFTHQFLPRHIGGTEAYTLALAREARRAGHDAAVLTCHESPSADPSDFGLVQTEYEAIPIFELHYNLSCAGHPARAEFDNPFAAGTVRELLRSCAPDIVHVMHAMKLSGSALKVCADLDIPFIVTLCDYWFICPRHTLLRWDETLCPGPARRLQCVKCVHATHGFAAHPWMDLAEPALLRRLRLLSCMGTLAPSAFRADVAAVVERPDYLRAQLLKARRIIALSPFLKRMFVHNGFPADRIEVIPHVPDRLAIRRVPRLPGEPVRLSFIGALVPWKGAHVLVEAMRRIPDAPIACRIYGSLDSGDDYVANLVREAGADRRITLMGRSAPDQLGDVLGQTDVLAAPALWYENEPLVVKSARQLGIPVLAAAIGSLPDMVTDGVDGTLLPPGDAAAWSECLDRVARHGPSAIARTADPAVDRPSVLSVEDNARAIFRVYEEAASPVSADRCVVHLVDQLPACRVESGPGSRVTIHSVVIGRRAMSAIFQHPVSRIQFPPLRVPADAELRFAVGVRPSAWRRMGDPILFEIARLDRRGAEQTLYRRVVHPREIKDDRRWIEERIRLGAHTRRGIRLVFKTSCAGAGDTRCAWAVWGEPRIVSAIPAPTIRARRPARGHVILITADALRRDVLGCYGDATMRTPHINRLAEEGALFLDARAPSSTTPGSYASMLTGLSPLRHGLHAEWGSLSPHLPGLPGWFAERGYRTVMCSSEDELHHPLMGFGARFDEVAAAIGSPAQAGAITTRSAIREIAGAPRESFFWVQYFDVHPPSMAPDPFARWYYRGDPDAAENRYRPEALEEIDGVETVAEFSRKLASLEKGVVDHAVRIRLRATARALRGEGGAPPDLAVHLRALPPRARLDMSLDAFAGWLDSRVRLLDEGRIPADLLDWIRLITEELRVVEDEILMWLDGVRDFRYPVAQYKSCVSYFDHQVGALTAFLRGEGLYDDATIILASPHGELLDELGIHFHHHALLDPVLRVPLIIKTPRSAGIPAGSCVGGVFDLVDLYPTLAGMRGDRLSHPVDGISRWDCWKAGEAMPEHDSFALCAYGQMASITRGPYTLLRALATFRIADRWDWREGDQMLIESDQAREQLEDLSARRPDLAHAMEQRLTDWLSAGGAVPGGCIGRGNRA